ncbi:hypothetical protein QTP88_026055 [Uroleucon formosanum]
MYVHTYMAPVRFYLPDSTLPPRHRNGGDSPKELLYCLYCVRGFPSLDALGSQPLCRHPGTSGKLNAVAKTAHQTECKQWYPELLAWLTPIALRSVGMDSKMQDCVTLCTLQFLQCRVVVRSHPCFDFINAHTSTARLKYQTSFGSSLSVGDERGQWCYFVSSSVSGCFIAAVDSCKDVPNIEKFYYLLGCLELEASKLADEASSSSGIIDRLLKPSKFTKEWQKSRKPSTSLIEAKPDGMPPSNNDNYGHNPTIIADILSQQLTFGIRRIYTHLKLEDSYFDTPAPVELLLDVDKAEEPDEPQFTNNGCCEAKFKVDIVINETGRYSVLLPFRQNLPFPTFGIKRSSVQTFRTEVGIIFISVYAIIVDETQFVSLCKRRSTQLRTLSLVEVNESLIIAIKYSQLVHFWSLLRKSSQKSRILSKPFVRLSPYLDSEGIIRVVSCLNNSQIPDRQKHLVLLSKTSHLSKLIVHHWHNGDWNQYQKLLYLCLDNNGKSITDHNGLITVSDCVVPSVIKG